jgi:dipeptidyl aminopeptidase/acylaminoacyl peptidase
MCTQTIRLIRHLTAFGLSLFVALGVHAQDDQRTKEIQEVEKKLEELKAKLATLKSQSPTPSAKKALQLKDMLTWKMVSRTALTRDGQWFACALTPGEGKSEVILRHTMGDKEHRFPANEMINGFAFSQDGRWFAFSSTPRAKAGETPEQSKTVLVNIANNDKVEYDGVTRFSFSGEASTAIALYKSQASAGAAIPTMGPTTRPKGVEMPTPPRARGGDLVLRELATGKEMLLGNVFEFAFDKKGDYLALTLDTQGQLGNGVQLRNLKTGVLTQLDSGKATYQNLHWSEKGEAISVLKGTEDKAYKDKHHAALVFTNLSEMSPTMQVYDPGKDNTFPKGMAISNARTVVFSEDLGTIYFGIREQRKADSPMAKSKGIEKKVDPTKGNSGDMRAKGEKEKPDLVIWHGKDSRLQAQQQVQANEDQMRNYLCAYRLKDKKFTRLADESLRNVSVAPKDRFAVGFDTRAYELAGSLHGRRYQDLHVIDLQTGEKHLALKQARNVMNLSPDGAKMLYFDEDGHFYVYDMANKKKTCISKSAPVSFVNTEDDHNVVNPPTRPIGWTKDSSAVLISDNWDIWRLPIGEGSAINLTGNGRKDGLRYQMRFNFDPEEKGIDLEKPQYFTLYGEWTKKSGFVRLDPKATTPTVLCWDDAAFSTLIKARDADVFVHTRETATASPDYYATDASFTSPKRLTNTNPQQDNYLWSSGSMLVNYESAKGDKLQGALYLPANYEKGKKYPTIVYIYERLSQGKNRYPMPRGWGFSPAMYTSNGYAVFTPDIRYKINDPGMSAVWCVLPALEAAIATGVVDKERVGLQGHSWGGYQTAFLITQTKAFKAAVAGAPLTNLISMYSSVYWNTGWANQPIFESSQGRFTGGYWEQQEAYMRNSPVFHAKNVETPLMLLHNDKDGAVDFNQGIEYFNTLRRLEKPVVMLQYKGENHGLAKPANQKDYTVRMREFFDHHLMGKEAPLWLKEGVPHLKMEEHLKERSEGQ